MGAKCCSGDLIYPVMFYGPGGSGKSTIGKCLRLLFAAEEGVSDPERNYAALIKFQEDKEIVVRLIRRNIVEAAAVLCKQANALYPTEYEVQFERLGLGLITGKNEMKAGSFLSDQANVLLAFWGSELGQKVWARRLEFDIHDNASLFIPICNKTCNSGWSPSLDEYLSTREETVILTKYTVELPSEGRKKRSLEILDVGGQASHVEVYRGDPLYNEFLQRAGLLFVVIAVGDLETERENGLVTEGFRVLSKVLAEGNKKDGQGVIWGDSNFNKKIVVGYLNKQDKLKEAIERAQERGDVPGLLENWRIAALSRMTEDESVLRDAISKANSAVTDLEGAQKFFMGIAEYLSKIHRPLTPRPVPKFPKSLTWKEQDAKVEWEANYPGPVFFANTTAIRIKNGEQIKETVEKSINHQMSIGIDDMGFYEGAAFESTAAMNADKVVRQRQVENPIVNNTNPAKKEKVPKTTRRSSQFGFDEMYGEHL